MKRYRLRSIIDLHGYAVTIVNATFAAQLPPLWVVSSEQVAHRIKRTATPPYASLRGSFARLLAHRRDLLEMCENRKNTAMIDDRKKAQELIKQMKKHLPLPIYAGKTLLHMLQKKGVQVKFKQRLHIKDVFYAGDDGGIVCALDGLASDQAAYVCSLTHLKVADDTPLKEEIQVYQRERTYKLEQEARGASSLGLKLRSK